MRMPSKTSIALVQHHHRATLKKGRRKSSITSIHRNEQVQTHRSISAHPQSVYSITCSFDASYETTTLLEMTSHALHSAGTSILNQTPLASSAGGTTVAVASQSFLSDASGTFSAAGGKNSNSEPHQTSHSNKSATAVVCSVAALLVIAIILLGYLALKDKKATKKHRRGRSQGQRSSKLQTTALLDTCIKCLHLLQFD